MIPVPSDNAVDTVDSVWRKIGLWLSVSGAFAIFAVVVLAWAEFHAYWQVAQTCVVVILLLLSWAAWIWWERRRKPVQLSVNAEVYHLAIHKVLVCVAVGLAAVVLNGIRLDRWTNGLVAQGVGYGILFAGATLITGVLIGYLFGLRPSGQTKNAEGQVAQTYFQSNLEEIADWLTKLILGAGLVELTKLPTVLHRVAEFMARGVDPGPDRPGLSIDRPGNASIALAYIGFFSTCGILYGYLWTRYEHTVAGDAAAAASTSAAVVAASKASAVADVAAAIKASAVADAAAAIKASVPTEGQHDGQ